MRIQLTSISKLSMARRQLRRSGLRLTVRYGQVYTVRAVAPNHPDSQAQLRSRNILSQASALAKRELEDPERNIYWMTHAAELGYKTARGACVAHHIKQLREQAAAEAVAPVKTETVTATVWCEVLGRLTQPVCHVRLAELIGLIRPVAAISPPVYSPVWRRCFWEKRGLKSALRHDKRGLKSTLRQEKRGLKSALRQEKRGLKSALRHDKRGLKSTLRQEKRGLKSTLRQHHTT